MGRILLLVFLIFVGREAYSDTLVAFVPSPDEAHRALFGTYYHTAVRVDGHWWEASPYYGVHRSNHWNQILQRPGVRVLRSPASFPQPSTTKLLQVEGAPFDLHSRWGDTESFNCTELVAYALNVNHYAVPIVEEGFEIGELGLSPDRLFAMLQADGWTLEVTHSDICREVLLY